MIDQDEMFTRMAKEIIKSMAIAMLERKEMSKEFAASGKKEDVEKNIDKISNEITAKLVENLRKQGDKDLTKQEFESLLKKTVEEYFGDLAENKTKD